MSLTPEQIAAVSARYPKLTQAEVQALSLKHGHRAWAYLSQLDCQRGGKMGLFKRKCVFAVTGDPVAGTA